MDAIEKISKKVEELLRLGYARRVGPRPFDIQLTRTGMAIGADLWKLFSKSPHHWELDLRSTLPGKTQRDRVSIVKDPKRYTNRAEAKFAAMGHLITGNYYQVNMYHIRDLDGYPVNEVVFTPKDLRTYLPPAPWD